MWNAVTRRGETQTTPIILVFLSVQKNKINIYDP